MQTKQIWNSFLLFLTAAIWGTSFVAQSVGMEYVGAFTFSAARSLLGGMALVPVILLMDRKREKDRKTLFKGGIACGILMCLALNFQQVGIRYTTVAKAGFITAFYIVIVPCLGMIFLKKRYGSRVWVSVVLALAGLYLLCITDGFGIGKGDGYVLICSFLFSLHILVIDHYSPLVSGVKMSCIQFFVCGILSAILAVILENPSPALILKGGESILYAGILSCGVAYTLQIVGQKHVNPTAASLILSLESCISVIAGWLILGQTLTLREGIGCILMFAAVILSQIPERKRQEAAVKTV